MLLTNASRETGSEEYTPNLFWLGYSRSGCVCVCVCACLNPKWAVAFEIASYLCFAPTVETFDLLAQEEDQHHAKYLSDLLKQRTFKQSTFFKKKIPFWWHNSHRARVDYRWLAMQAPGKWTWWSSGFLFLSLSSERIENLHWDSTCHGVFIITKIFTHNFCKYPFLSVWHRPRNSRQYLSY